MIESLKPLNVVFFCGASLILSSCVTTDINDPQNTTPLVISKNVIENDGIIAGITFFEPAPSDFEIRNQDRESSFFNTYVKKNHMGYDLVYLTCGKGEGSPVCAIKLVKFVPKFPSYKLISIKNAYADKISERLGVPYRRLPTSEDRDGAYYWVVNSREYFLEKPSKYKKDCAISNYFTSVDLWWFDREDAELDMVYIEIRSKKLKELRAKEITQQKSEIKF